MYFPKIMPFVALLSLFTFCSAAPAAGSFRANFKYWKIILMRLEGINIRYVEHELAMPLKVFAG
jgi:hypothetical protein